LLGGGWGGEGSRGAGGDELAAAASGRRCETAGAATFGRGAAGDTSALVDAEPAATALAVGESSSAGESERIESAAAGVAAGCNAVVEITISPTITAAASTSVAAINQVVAGARFDCERSI